MRNKTLMICAILLLSSFFSPAYYVKASEDKIPVEEVIAEEEAISVDTDLTEEELSEEENAEEVSEEVVENITEEEENEEGDVLEEPEEEKEQKKKKKDKKKKKPIIQYTEEEFKLLVCTMFAEGGNQPYKAKLCYANAILNRVKQKDFPNSIRGVIYHALTSKNGKKVYQFAVAKPGGSLEKHLKKYGKRKHPTEKKFEKECIKAAKAALEGENPLGDYAFFASANSPIRYQQTDGILVNGAYFYRYHWKPWKKKK